MTAWRKPRRSKNYGDCVEVSDSGGVQVRDSKRPGPVLRFGATAWAAFTARVREGGQ